MMKNYLRKEILLDKDEVMLLRFAMKCTGLDMTTTMRFLLRQGVIDLILQYKGRGIPKLPAELEKFVAEF